MFSDFVFILLQYRTVLYPLTVCVYYLTFLFEFLCEFNFGGTNWLWSNIPVMDTVNDMIEAKNIWNHLSPASGKVRKNGKYAELNTIYRQRISLEMLQPIYANKFTIDERSMNGYATSIKSPQNKLISIPLVHKIDVFFFFSISLFLQPPYIIMFAAQIPADVITNVHWSMEPSKLG